MIGTIRKHQTWLWAIIITITVASFVIFGPTNSRLGDAFGNHANYGTVSGHAITKEEHDAAAREVALDTFLKTQQWPNDNSADFNTRVYYRIFVIQKEQDLGVDASAAAMAGLAGHILGPTPLDDFVEKGLKPAGLGEQDFENYLRHELGLQQMMVSVGVNGKLVTPQEAQTLYRAEHTDVDADLIFFSASNYMAGVTVTPAILQEFYTNQVEHYRVPDMVSVEYVKFAVTNYYTNTLATLTNLDQIVDLNVQKMGTNLFHGAKTAAESRTALRYEIIRQHAIAQARRDANTFAQTVDAMTPRTNANLAAEATKEGLKVGTTAPFERDFGPSDITVPPDFARKAFSLTMEDPFAGDIVADDGVYIIALKQNIPAETPPFAKVKSKVEDDYRFASALQLAQQAALAFNATLSTNLAQGKSFDAICAQAGVKFQSLPPFSLSTRELPPEIQEKVGFASLRQATFGTPIGKVSPVDGARDGAFMVYVEKQLPVDEAKLKAELPGYTAYLRSVRQNDAFNQWFSVQIKQDPIFNVIQQINSTPQMRSAGEGRPAS